MALNSFSFWLLFPLIFGIYWLISRRYHSLGNGFLVLVSYLLYMSWKPAFALVLLAVTLVTYWGAILLETSGHSKRRKSLAWLLALCGLFPLLCFKYAGFINSNISSFLAALGFHFSLPGLNWAVPLGISFYTFQALGYMLDVYHGKTKSERNLLDYMLFISFFPQVMSGPISTAASLMPQIKTRHGFVFKQGVEGLKMIVWGLFVKMVIADRFGLYVDTVYANYLNLSGATCLMASFLYTMQLYCDFAGYSLLAIGTARLLGFELINNFHRPYLAVSITDFWKRWHISLTNWFKQQVYIPLGGSRCSKLRNYWNLLVTFLVSGIWHGANWTFLLWGLLHGVALIIEKLFGWQKCTNVSFGIRFFRICITFLFFNFSLIVFRMPTIRDAFLLMGHLVSDFGELQLASLGGGYIFWVSLLAILLVVFKELRDEFFPTHFSFVSTPWFQAAFYTLLFCSVLSFGVLDGGQFIYANF